MARIKRVPLEQFESAMQDILNQWKDDCTVGAKQVIREAGKKGTKLVKQYAKKEFKRHSRRRTYYTQWANKVTHEDNSDIQVTVYCRKYQLPHLLEYSHVTGPKRRGKYKGREHVGKAQREIDEWCEKALKGMVRDIS